ncbi:MAG: 4-hydroxy-tetrahydrodipicolinate reductase [Actinobacteria bacterium]|nr:4-hydroxy-tetrahydrodipicolinate reductase [Actinomycetota bacterium]
MTISVAVSGATGRLGEFVCGIVEDHPDFELTARFGSASPADEGADASVLFDVTHPDVSPAIVERALRRGQRVIVGTSGWSAERLDGLRAVVEELPGAAALVVPNFSLGSVLGTMLSTIAARHFDSIEIIEAHHAGKIDSPSGTAVRTAELVAQARDGRPPEAPFVDQRARGQLVAGVPVHSLRMQGVVARQEVRFGGEGEELTITHVTHSNDSYRAGIRAALEAVSGLEGLVVGLEHVLGLAGASRAARA